jgi:hypothetical protein
VTDEKAKSYMRKAGTAMLVLYVSIIFVVLAVMCVAGFYVFNVGGLKTGYTDKAEIIVRRYLRTVNNLNELESNEKVTFAEYRDGIEDALYDLREAHKDMELLGEPTSSELAVLDSNIRTALGCGINCLDAERKYLNQVSPVADKIKMMEEYKRRADSAKSDYEKRLYEQRYNALKATLGPNFKSAEGLTADVRRLNNEFAQVSMDLAPQIEYHFDLEGLVYKPDRIHSYTCE